jgi:pyrroloquinoline quinone biosynthesis protein E
MSPSANPPVGLLAELTYRCPLHCPYCSNPLNLDDAREELTLDEWQRVLAQARALGVWQLHLSGGEPLQRRDLQPIISHARSLGFYTNLITSAVGLTSARAAALKQAGLDHMQISIQAGDAARSDRIAGTPAFARKIAAARLVKDLGFPLTLNVVLHRHNLDQMAGILALAEEVRADRLELANTQYYGWALRNRAALLPTRTQLEHAEAMVRAARARLAGQMEIIYVVADYYSRYPKPCMQGWGRQQMTITPTGAVLPCPAAAQLPGLRIPHVQERPLEWIWEESSLFRRFRDLDWMDEPCCSCPRRARDFGGCRCQAFLLTGDLATTDPVCHLAPQHDIVRTIVREVNEAAEAAGPAPELTEDMYRRL